MTANIALSIVIIAALFPLAFAGVFGLASVVLIHECARNTEHIHQAIASLLGNVRQHTPAGTQAIVTVWKDDSASWLTVSDDGPGVDPAILPHLFDRFFRGDESRARDSVQSGSGLGLSIVRAIVMNLGGQVYAGICEATGGLPITLRFPNVISVPEP